MSTSETPPSGSDQPAETEPIPAPAPPAPEAAETMAWPPATATAAAPGGPKPPRSERFRGWLGNLTPLAAGAFAVLLLLVGFGAGALVVHAGQDSNSQQAPFGHRDGFGPGQRGPEGQQGQQRRPGQQGQQGQPGQQGQRNGPGQRQQDPQAPNGAGGAFGGGFGAATAGTIVSVDGSTMTVRTASGANVKVTISSNTAIRITNSGTASDLKAGARVVVVGQNSNGSVAARSVTSGSAIPAPGGSAQPS
jgi:hypothetical protein